MPSNAFSGVGTVFGRGDGTSNETFTAIAEINNITGPGMSRAFIDVTSLDSTGGYREFIGGFRDAGEITMTMNFTRDTFLDMKADFESDAAKNYRITFPDTGLTMIDFSGVCTGLSVGIPMDDKVTSNVTIKVDGQITVSS